MTELRNKAHAKAQAAPTAVRSILARIIRLDPQRLRGCALLAIAGLAAIFSIVGIWAASPGPMAAAVDCGGQQLSGRWINRAKQEGSDLLAVQISIPCTDPAATVQPGANPAGRTELRISTRCLHVLSCDWDAIAAAWSAPIRRNGNPVLAAEFQQDRFERTVSIEPIEGGRIRLTLVSRFKGTVISPITTVYLLDRSRA